MATTADQRAALRARTLHRLDILARQFEQLAGPDLRRIALTADTPERGRLRARAENAAIGAGLGGILADARSRFRERLIVIGNASGFDPTPVGLNWGRTNGPATDRVEISVAVDDAVLATVAHDLIDQDERRALSEPCDILVSMRRGPSTLAGRAGPAPD